MKHHQTVALLYAWIVLGAPARAQDYEPSPLQVRLDGDEIVFEADVCLSTNADGPTTPVGIPRLKVEMVYERWVIDHYEDHDLVQATDAEGRITVPPGHRPLYGDVWGPQSADLLVLQEGEIGGTRFEIEPVATLEFRGGPMVLPIPTFTGSQAQLAPFFIRSSHLNAYVHAQRAFDVLRTKVGPASGRLPLRFLMDRDDPRDADTDPDILDYVVLRSGARAIRVWAAANPDEAVIARSGTGIAHEVGHHFLDAFGFQHDYDDDGLNLCYAPSDQFDEGLADYLACVVTGHSVVGDGVLGITPRVIANNPSPKYRDVDDCATIPDEHVRGMVIAGCLLDARQRFSVRVLGGEARFDAMAREALDALRALVPNIIDLDQMPDEASVLQYLIDSDSEATSLRILYEAFTLGGGVPWPYFWVPTGFGVTIPELSASVSASHLNVSIARAAPGAPLLVLGSYDPREAWIFGPASLYLDPHTVRVLATPTADGGGSAAFSMALPAGVAGLDVAMSAVVLPSAGQAAVSNGIRLRL